MNTMTAEGQITRDELSLPILDFGTLDLDADGAGVYIARDGWNIGENSYRRITAESPYINGRTLVHRVADTQTSTLKLRIKGSSQADLYDRMNELAIAFSQFSYTLTINVNGRKWSFLCETADMSAGDGGSVNDLMLRSNIQYLNFTIPHTPNDYGTYTGTGTFPVIE